MLYSFSKDKKGNFGMTLALAMLPLMMGIGAAVDYTNVSRNQTNLQNSLDSAILAVGHDFESMKKSEIRKKVKDFLKSNLSKDEYAQIKHLVINKDNSNNSLTITAKGKTATDFMMLAGIDKLKYDAVSQIKSASGGAEIVFVLDNTGSMSLDGKLDALKTAAKGFTNAIMLKNTGGDVKIGIVPFANHVNVGLSNRNASWIDVPDDYDEDYPENCYMRKDVIAGSCTTGTATNSEGQTYTTTSGCSYGPEYEYCAPAGTSTYSWQGCVGSRQEPYNLEDRKYGTDKVPGLLNVWCSAEITPLTNVKSTVINEIDSMTANGNTYIPSGLTWGMRLLSSKAPYSEAVSKKQASKKNIKKILILMTDGDNTASAQLPGAATHWGTDTDQANDWTEQVCDNIKAEQTSVYTITFGTLLPETKTLIKECASSDTQYFHAATGDELGAAFEDIRGQIMALHLSM